MMTTITGLLTVLALGVVALPAAFPVGVSLGMSPALVGVVSAVGAFASFFAVVLLGGSLRRWLVSRYHLQRSDGSPSRIARLWQRYGPAGVGLIAPLLVGVPIATALGVSLGIPARRLGAFMAVTIVGSCAFYTGLSYLGLLGVDAVRN